MAESELVRRLRSAGSVFAEEEAALLMAENADRVARGERDQLEAMTARRIAGDPIEQIVGWAEFDGMRFFVLPGVFVPRHRSEFLVARAAALGRPGAVILDLCCGIGALGASVRTRLGRATLYAADLDPAAVRCARINVGPETPVFEGDLYAPLPPGLRGTVDLLLANAPYVPSGEVGMMPPEAREHEHLIALDGGDDGLALHRRVIREAPDWLAPGGRLFIEVSEAQAPVAASSMREAGLTAGVDADDDATIVIGTRPA